MNWEERKKYYDKEYYDGLLEGHYRDWWWSDISVWGTRALVIREAFIPKTVLDCGCAKGSLVKFLRQMYNIEAYGFDLSEYAIKNTNFPEISQALFILDVAENDIPFGDRYFDVSCCFDIIEHNDNDHIQLVCDRIKKVTNKYILIRQPILDVPLDIQYSLHKQLRGKPLIERFNAVKYYSYVLANAENIEHPNTRTREQVIELFRDEFTEIFLDPFYYDIVMGSDDTCVTPVLPFYDTIVLQRKE